MTTLKKQRNYFPNIIKDAYTTIVAADSTNYKDLYTAPADGALITMLTVANEDTASRTVQFAIRVAGVDRPISNGFAVVNAQQQDALNGTNIPGLDLNNQGKRYIKVPGGAILRARVVSAVSTNSVRVYASAWEYEVE